MRSASVLAGIDGCRAGWLVVVSDARKLTALVSRDFAALIQRMPKGTIAIDIPIGLPDRGSRACDIEARRLLGRPRGSSVFPAPIRAVLGGGTREVLSRRHQRIDGRRLSVQTFCLLPKIGDVDHQLVLHPRLRRRVHEIHPEVSFAIWNGGAPMRFRKSRPEGRKEREQLIDREWPGERTRLRETLRGADFAPDDLNDAFAALWSARRIANGNALPFPKVLERDPQGIAMQIQA